MERSAVRDRSQETARSAGLRSFLRTHRRLAGAAAGGGVALAILGFLWFRPDKILVNTTVNEGLPANVPAAGDAQVLSTGPFRSLEHETRGRANVVRLTDGRRFVRFEGFATSNGPDVVVILSDAPAGASMGAFDDGRFVSLGALRGNVGNQNYEIPASADLTQYRSIVVWCRRFNVAFGVAPLEASG